MSLIRDAKVEWSVPVTLQSDEIWQARSGCVYLTTSDSPDSDDGLCMVLRDGIRIGAGLSVRYRCEAGAPALIARESV